MGIGACCSYAAARQDGNVIRERGYGEDAISENLRGDLAAGTVSMGGSYMSGDGRVCLSLYGRCCRSVCVKDEVVPVDAGRTH